MTTTPPISISPRAFNEAGAATYIGMSRSFLARSRTEGRRENRTAGPDFIVIGRTVRYLRDDLDRWLSEQQRFEFLDQVI